MKNNSNYCANNSNAARLIGVKIAAKQTTFFLP
jgi:hypothetical protein